MSLPEDHRRAGTAAVTSPAPGVASGDETAPPPARGPKRRSRPAMIAIAVALLGLLAVPLADPTGSVLLMLSTIFMWIVLTSSWNLISGFTGYIDFGHAVFFGLGAYASGILMNRLDWPIWPTLPVAFVVAVIFAVLVGVPLLRLRGVYFSIAMLGAFMAMRELARIVPITGGAQGLTLPPIVNRPLFYYTFLAGAASMIALVSWLRNSQLGFSLLSIREDEEGAEARGINTTALKLLAFCTSASITAIVGGLWAYQTTFIDPNIVFQEVFLVTLALMTVLGGMGTVWGPVVGTVFFITIRDTLWAQWPDAHLFLFGLALIFVVLFLPEGVLGTIQRGDRTVLGRRIKQLRVRHQTG